MLRLDYCSDSHALKQRHVDQTEHCMLYTVSHRHSIENIKFFSPILFHMNMKHTVTTLMWTFGLWVRISIDNKINNGDTQIRIIFVCCTWMKSRCSLSGLFITTSSYPFLIVRLYSISISMLLVQYRLCIRIRALRLLHINYA